MGYGYVGIELWEFFMGKIIDWLKNNWLVAAIIAVLSVVAVVILLELVGCLNFFDASGQTLVLVTCCGV